MSSVSAHSGAGPSVESGARGSTSFWRGLTRGEPAAVTVASLIAVAFLGLYFRWLSKQFTEFSVEFFQDWGHAFVVPIISLAYVWKHRASIRSAEGGAWWPGIGLVLTGVGAYAYFLFGFSNHMFQGFAMVLTLAGVVLTLAGPAVFQKLFFPIMYLLFAVTIAEQVMNSITWPLQILATYGAWILLEVLQVNVVIDGNVITVTDGMGETHPLNVAEACSGMRMVVAFIALAVAVAFFSCKQWWQRFGVFLVAVPVALAMNIVRVAVLAGLTLYDPDLAVGGAHSMIGTILLVPGFLVFMACVWLLNKIDRDSSEGAKP